MLDFFAFIQESPKGYWTSLLRCPSSLSCTRTQRRTMPLSIIIKGSIIIFLRIFLLFIWHLKVLFFYPWDFLCTRNLHRAIKLQLNNKVISAPFPFLFLGPCLFFSFAFWNDEVKCANKISQVAWMYSGQVTYTNITIILWGFDVLTPILKWNGDFIFIF